MTDSDHPDSRTSTRLAGFRLDVEYTRLAPAFTDAGIRTILLKGPAFDQLLFDGTRSRAYADIDLLVDPEQVAVAEWLLEQRGFHRARRESPGYRLARRAVIALGLVRAPHATAWIRDRDRFTIDLHHTLPLTKAPAGRVWCSLAARAVTIMVVDAPVETIDRPASALLIALHAAHHGPAWARASTDLGRACHVLERDCWRDAARLARELGAEAAMGIGLGTSGDGAVLARELGLRTTPAATDRLRWSVRL